MALALTLAGIAGQVIVAAVAAGLIVKVLYDINDPDKAVRIHNTSTDSTVFAH